MVEGHWAFFLGSEIEFHYRKTQCEKKCHVVKFTVMKKCVWVWPNSGTQLIVLKPYFIILHTCHIMVYTDI